MTNFRSGDPEERNFRQWEVRQTQFAAHTAAVSSYVGIAINSIILTNSAAAGTVLAFLGSIWGTAIKARILADALTTLTIFALGAAAGMSISLAAYASQSLALRSDLHLTPEQERTECLRWAGVWRKTGFGLAVVGIVLFAVGVIYGLWSLAADGVYVGGN